MDIIDRGDSYEWDGKTVPKAPGNRDWRAIADAIAKGEATVVAAEPPAPAEPSPAELIEALIAELGLDRQALVARAMAKR